MKSLIIIGIGGLVLAGLAAAVWLGAQKGATRKVGANGEAGQFLELTLNDLNGKAVRLSDFKTPLVVNAWAVWCPFCVDELPDFAAVQQEFGEQVTVIAIDRAETPTVVQKFVEDLGIRDKLVFLLDPQDSLYKAIGGFSMPETVFVRKDGSVQFHKRGPMQIDEIRQRIGDLLAEE